MDFSEELSVKLLPAGDIGKFLQASLSPDGRILAIDSISSAINLWPFPEFDSGRWQVPSSGVGVLWSATGDELFFQVGETIMVAEVQTDPTLVVGNPRELFTLPDAAYLGRSFDLGPDGRFLMLKHNRRSDRIV